MEYADIVEICDTLDKHGFHEAFMYYTAFEDVKDKEFHRLRKEYIEISKKLSKHIGFGEGDIL